MLQTPSLNENRIQETCKYKYIQKYIHCLSSLKPIFLIIEYQEGANRERERGLVVLLRI